METFINFYFWWLSFFMVVQAIIIATRKYPYVNTKSIGDDIFKFILVAAFFVWILLIRLGVIQS